MNDYFATNDRSNKVVLGTNAEVMSALIPQEIDGARSFNPFALASADEMEALLRGMCSQGPADKDAVELDDQIEALVPAVVELRDGGHVELSVASLVSFATLDGFSRLANDARLSDLARQRCEAIRVRIVVQGVKALLGHN